MQKPSMPKGTRDFMPEEMIKRNYVFNIIQNVFHLYGFQEIKTPAIESLSTLLGKYGKEGDKLLFRILNSGNLFSKEGFTEGIDELVQKISKKGLRYDLTVPLARFVVMHQHEIVFPFKRFQIQPVWRADRPQKGRYREFFQCDADIVGSNSLLNEIELLQMADEIFHRLHIKVCIKLNHRKILEGIAEIVGEKNRMMEIVTTLDKVDKVGIEQVNRELIKKGISNQSINKLQSIFFLKNSNNSNQEKIKELKNIFNASTQGQIGLKEIEILLFKICLLPIHNEIKIDLTLSRGLNYYTGTIFEIQCTDLCFGSIAGGGRYDDLTGIFGMPNLPGVGISFGADRIFDILNQLCLYPKDKKKLQPSLLFVNFGENEENHLLPLVLKVRKNGIRAEIYPDADKISKQLSYANARQIPWVAMLGSKEIVENTIVIKNMTSWKQFLINIENITDFILHSTT